MTRANRNRKKSAFGRSFSGTSHSCLLFLRFRYGIENSAIPAWLCWYVPPVVASHTLTLSSAPLAVVAAFEGAAYFQEGEAAHVLVAPRGRVNTLDPFEGAATFATADEGAPLFLGVLPYEAFRATLERPAWSVAESRPHPLCSEIEWTRFDACISFRGTAARVVAEDDETLARVLIRLESALTLPPAPVLSVAEIEAPELHCERVRVARERILEGEFYQVNLARALGVRVAPSTTRAQYIALLDRLATEFPAQFRFFLTPSDGTVVIGSSPELAMAASPSADGRSFEVVETWPIKGTRARGSTDEEDGRLRHELEHDPKERAELAMIIDVERNDVHRIAQPGSVHVESPTTDVLRTVFHRIARVAGRCREGVTRTEVMRALLPCGSVTGAPKVRAMEVIAELESTRRGLYTGAVGVMTRGGTLRLAMAIRTMVFGADGSGNYAVGGGIVEGSVPLAELEETRWKAAQVFRLQKNTM